MQSEVPDPLVLGAKSQTVEPDVETITEVPDPLMLGAESQTVEIEMTTAIATPTPDPPELGALVLSASPAPDPLAISAAPPSKALAPLRFDFNMVPQPTKAQVNMMKNRAEGQQTDVSR